MIVAICLLQNHQHYLKELIQIVPSNFFNSYYKDGTVAAGPPPKPLTKIEVRINKADVEIRTAPVPITTGPLSPGGGT